MSDRSSVTKGVDCGVPHGCCLAPIIFLVYAKDFPYGLKTSGVATSGVQLEGEVEKMKQRL